jgi:hypothetical protein
MRRGILYRTVLIAGLLAISLVALAPSIPGVGGVLPQ